MLDEILIKIDDLKLMKAFLKDLCTPKELSALNERLEVAKLLSQGELSYREIHAKTKVSLVTITRVARFLKTEKNNGYKKVFKFIEGI